MNQIFINTYFNIKFTDKTLILENLLTKLSKRNSINNIINLIFYYRNCKYGRGFRYKGRIMLLWLLNNYPINFIEIIPYIPIYGRWDDLFFIYNETIYTTCKINQLFIKKIKKLIIFFVYKRLKQDILLNTKNKKISLIIKWFPSEKSKRYHNIYCKIRKLFKITSKTFRQTIITPLRKKLNLFENNTNNLYYYNSLSNNNIRKYYSQIIKYKNISHRIQKKSLIWKIFNNSLSKITLIQLTKLNKTIFNQSIMYLHSNPNIYINSKIPVNIISILIYINLYNTEDIYYYNKLIISKSFKQKNKKEIYYKNIKYKRNLTDIIKIIRNIYNNNILHLDKLLDFILYTFIKNNINKIKQQPNSQLQTTNIIKYLWIIGYSNNIKGQKNIIINKYKQIFNTKNIYFPYIIFWDFTQDITIINNQLYTIINGYNKELLFNIIYNNYFNAKQIINQKFKKFKKN